MAKRCGNFTGKCLFNYEHARDYMSPRIIKKLLILHRKITRDAEY